MSISKDRVLEDKGIQSGSPNDGLLENLLNTYKRAASAEIPFARVPRSLQGHRTGGYSRRGRFSKWESTSRRPCPPPRSGRMSTWRCSSRAGRCLPLTVGAVFIASCGRAVWGDQRYRRYGDPDRRRPLAAHSQQYYVGECLDPPAVQRGERLFTRPLPGRLGAQCNPLFFVSASPWNLYDLLVDLFNLHGIPGGPLLFLRDWGFGDNDFIPTHTRVHKLSLCKLIMEDLSRGWTLS